VRGHLELDSGQREHLDERTARVYRYGYTPQERGLEMRIIQLAGASRNPDSSSRRGAIQPSLHLGTDQPDSPTG